MGATAPTVTTQSTIQKVADAGGSLLAAEKPVGGDMRAKMREDPLMLIRQREAQHGRGLTAAQAQMQRLREEELEREYRESLGGPTSAEKEKERRRHKHKEKRHAEGGASSDEEYRAKRRERKKRKREEEEKRANENGPNSNGLPTTSITSKSPKNHDGDLPGASDRGEAGRLVEKRAGEERIGETSIPSTAAPSAGKLVAPADTGLNASEEPREGASDRTNDLGAAGERDEVDSRKRPSMDRSEPDGPGRYREERNYDGDRRGDGDRGARNADYLKQDNFDHHRSERDRYSERDRHSDRSRDRDDFGRRSYEEDRHPRGDRSFDDRSRDRRPNGPSNDAYRPNQDYRRPNQTSQRPGGRGLDLTEEERDKALLQMQRGAQQLSQARTNLIDDTRQERSREEADHRRKATEDSKGEMQPSFLSSMNQDALKHTSLEDRVARSRFYLSKDE